MKKVKHFLRQCYNKRNIRQLRNTNITLIASNCNGGCILSDLNVPFNSPFVNLWLYPKDFLKVCENLRYYLDCNLVFTSEDRLGYPVGMLDDIKIFFQHYASKEDVKTTWERRKQRMDWQHIYIMFSDRDGCTYEDLLRFDRLPYERKVVFCHEAHPEIQSAVLIPGFENAESVGICSNYKSKFSVKKYYDAFDYVSWFNQTNGT